jgi:hypothetical protein
MYDTAADVTGVLITRATAYALPCRASSLWLQPYQGLPLLGGVAPAVACRLVS